MTISDLYSVQSFHLVTKQWLKTLKQFKVESVHVFVNSRIGTKLQETNKLGIEKEIAQPENWGTQRHESFQLTRRQRSETCNNSALTVNLSLQFEC